MIDTNTQTEALPTSTDICIIGGGMVGAALAALLANSLDDREIVLVEAFALPSKNQTFFQPSFDDRSTAIASGSVELLQHIGVWEQLREHATPIRQVHVSDKGHFGGSLINATEINTTGAKLDAVGYVVANAWLGRVLLSHLRQQNNVRLLSPAKVSQLQPHTSGAVLTLEMNEQTHSLHTQLSIIADGAESPLRKRLGIDVSRDDYQQTAIIANVRFEQPHQGVAYERFTDQGPMALLPLGGNDRAQESALVWTQPSQEADALLAMSDADFLKQLQARFGHRLGHFTQVGRRDSYPLQLIVASEQVRSSIAVMGNAAHFLHPVAGQGFNLALRDCASLCAQLKQAGEQPLGSLDLLQSYLRLQAQDQQTTIGFSHLLTKLFSNNDLSAAAVRGLGFLGLELVPPAKQFLARQMMGRSSRGVRL